MEIIKINNYDELKQYFMPIVSYWYKKGKIRMLPIGAFMKEVHKGNIYYLKDEGNCVGILSYIVNNLTAIRHHVVTKLEMLAIHKDHLRKGYGTQALDILKNKKQPIVLKVVEDNIEAIEFYIKNGFEKQIAAVGNSGVSPCGKYTSMVYTK